MLGFGLIAKIGKSLSSPPTADRGEYKNKTYLSAIERISSDIYRHFYY